MRLPALVALALFALGAGGCMTTHHVEQSHVSSVGLDGHGNLSSASESSHSERHWRGPWVKQPDQIRP